MVHSPGTLLTAAWGFAEAQGLGLGLCSSFFTLQTYISIQGALRYLTINMLYFLGCCEVESHLLNFLHDTHNAHVSLTTPPTPGGGVQ